MLRYMLDSTKVFLDRACNAGAIILLGGLVLFLAVVALCCVVMMLVVPIAICVRLPYPLNWGAAITLVWIAAAFVWGRVPRTV